ncbi:MAG: hypothetical protein JXA97_10450 [Anaerolineales bacterium]|nr:hypothetical protein [Anaerolineales bacterium]
MPSISHNLIVPGNNVGVGVRMAVETMVAVGEGRVVDVEIGIAVIVAVYIGIECAAGCSFILHPAAAPSTRANVLK